MKKKKLTVALAGNPNSGKTTIFNALTGARQHVGNYAGVTVEKKEGTCKYNGYEILFVDLPGTYSLTAYSIEEIVARDFIVSEHPDVVVAVVDSSNLERNLYLATQLLELNVPLVLALNMSDLAKKQGYLFDNEKIGTFFNAHTISTVGSKGKGINELLEAIIAKAEEEPSAQPDRVRVTYGEDIEKELAKIEPLVDMEHALAEKYGRRWLSLKLLEQDKEIIALSHKQEVLDATAGGIKNIEKIYGDAPEVIVAEKRYGFVSGVYEQAVKHTVQQRHQISDLIDMVLLNRLFGLPIFLLMMFLVFKMTFSAGEPMMKLIENGFGWLGGFVSGFWEQGSESPLRSLIVDGIIGGVGGVVVFLPNIILLFLGIAVLEDSGYMARAAFLMDRVMKKVGLHGRSFIPMMIGFGCSVPAIMGTRILDDRKSRLATIMILPLMSCGARLPIYALIIPAFFTSSGQKAFMMWLIYVIGVSLAILLALILRKTLLRGETGVFLMELPPYRMPTARGLLIHMWERSWLYLKKAGTVILAISIVMWALTSYPKAGADKLAGLDEKQAQQLQLRTSIAGRAGTAMEPLIEPMGFDYRIGTALVGALAAKEVFVAQMGIVFSVGDSGEGMDALRTKLRDNYTPLQGFCVMLFCLISAPCVATLAICRRETNSWKWAIFQFTGLTTIAYIITVIVYQVGSLFS
ncbi:MAG: ferrous iron transport protein B [Planctomycetes bacterium]|nr:ferrous iron transport protein B [Planctomycetota bacterium]